MIARDISAELYDCVYEILGGMQVCGCDAVEQNNWKASNHQLGTWQGFQSSFSTDWQGRATLSDTDWGL